MSWMKNKKVLDWLALSGAQIQRCHLSALLDIVAEERDKEWMDALERKYGPVVETQSVGMPGQDPTNHPETEEHRTRRFPHSRIRKPDPR